MVQMEGWQIRQVAEESGVWVVDGAGVGEVVVADARVSFRGGTVGLSSGQRRWEGKRKTRTRMRKWKWR